MGAARAGNDPLQDPALRGPGLLERFCGSVFGLSRPLQCVQVEITTFCGGLCTYCPHTTCGGNWPSRHMQAPTFARLWPLLRRSERAHLQGWGEPMLHPRFADFISLALRAGCRASTTSCGLAVTGPDAARRIAGSGLDMLAFSLAGTDEESNSVRRGVPFGRVCAAIELLNDALRRKNQPNGMEIHLAYLLLADRMEAARRLPALMRRLDVPVAVVSTLDYVALPAHSRLAFAPGERDKIHAARLILEDVASEAAADGRLVHFSLPVPEPVSPGCRENVDKCLYVDADGMVSPCVYLNVPGGSPEKRLVFGDARATDAWSIWQDEQFCSFRRDIMAGRCRAACADCAKRHEE